MSKDARWPALAIPFVAAWIVLVLSAVTTLGASYSTPNFVVTAPTAEFAKQVGDMAERYRDEIATDWLGKKLPRWSKPCPIQVKVGQIGAGGATTFCFDRGQVFGWNMNIQGSEERILDSVLPHEVSHTILACHFRRPLPRWADEGAATLVEHESERNRQVMLLNQVMRTSEKIPLRQLLSMKDYPKEMRQVLTLYAEGYSLAEFFVQQGGKARYLQFLEDAHRRNWDDALRTHYQIDGVSTLEKSWGEWVVAGMPPLPRRDGSQLAKNDAKAPAKDALIRSQSPDERTELASAAPARNSSLSAPDPRSRRPRETLSTGAEERASAADARSRNNGWAEQERLPRPSPLLARIEYQTAERGRNERNVAAERPAARRAPVFDAEFESASSEPPFESDPARVSASPAGDRAIPGFRDPPPFDETLEADVDADSPAPDWSAFPQAKTSAGAMRKGSFPGSFSP